MKVSIRSKILLIAVCIPTLAVGASTYIWSQEFNREYSGALKSKMLVIAGHLSGQLSDILEFGIPLDRVVGFERRCQEVVADHELVSYAMVVSLEGRILFHSDATQKGTTVTDPGIIRSIRSGKKSIEKYPFKGQGYYEAHVPVLNNNKEHVATIRLGFPSAIINDKIRGVVNYTALLSLLLLLLAVVCLIIAQFIWVARPLGNLVSLIHEIKKQGPSVEKRIGINTKDEIGELGSAFDEMMDHLREADEKLRDFNYRLQEEVDKRTRELKATTRQLEEEIQERKNTEEALRASEEELKKSEEKFRKVVHNAPVWVVLSTLDEGRILEVNEAFLISAGFKREEVIGRIASEVRLWDSPDSRERFANVLRKKGFVRNAEGHLHLRSGNTIEAIINAELIELENEKVIISIIQDITERNRLEAQLRQAQKMEAVGRLAGGIAHDFNNLMTTVIGNAQLAASEIGQDDPCQEMLTDIRKAGESAASLTRQLLAFSRKQALNPKVLDLNGVVSDMNMMLRRLIREDIELEMVLERELDPVKGDPGQIEQVIINLVVNARDAMPEGGNIIIETTTMEVDKDYLRRHSVEGKAGRYVVLSVKDTGTGMDRETVSKIFEPFFTTKEKGVGTGLGLSTVYGIIKQSGGFVLVRSEPGQGTTFNVCLPAAEGEVMALERGHQWTDDQLRGSETVLLAEDSEKVRKLASKGLKDLGYRVLEASNGEEAVKISREYGGPIDLLLSDVVMPKMSGVELMERLSQGHPQMKVLYMSGYTGDVILNRAVMDSAENYLQKPFTLRELGRKVREILDK